MDDIHFAWQAQYLVRLAGDFLWKAQLFVPLWELARTRHVVFYNTKSSRSWGWVRSPQRRVRDHDFVFGSCSDILGLWSNRLSFGGSTSGIFGANLDLQDFVSGAVFGEFGVEMTFSMWADHGRHSFCVAGALFGEVGGWLFVKGAALCAILGASRDATCCFLQYKIVSKLGRSKVFEAAGARWRFCVWIQYWVLQSGTGVEQSSTGAVLCRSTGIWRGST